MFLLAISAPPSPWSLLLLAAVSIVGLIVLVARFHCSAFIALLLASLFVGVGSIALGSGQHDGKPLSLPDIATIFDGGLGKALGSLGMIVALGTVLGKLLAESGAAEVIAHRLVQWLGVKRLDFALMLLGFLVGISVFFGVGLILLGPIAFSLSRETRTPILRLALPLAAGLSTAHGLIPPHPGPMYAINALHADVGKTILWSMIFGLPTALVTGPVLTRLVAPHVPVEMAGLGAQAASGGTAPRRPSFGVTVFTMLIPISLMLLSTFASVELPPENLARQIAEFFGAPTVALLVAVLVAFITFGRSCGFTGPQLLRFSEDCLAPAASLFVVIGAGGGFSAMLNASGVNGALATLAGGMNISPLILAWLIAGLLRIAIGSATVSIQVASGMMVTYLAANPGKHVNLELLVLSMGAGSLILSHVNDSGFWFVKEYLGMSVSQTLRTWTIVETGIAVTSLLLILVANVLV